MIGPPDKGTSVMMAVPETQGNHDRVSVGDNLVGSSAFYYFLNVFIQQGGTVTIEHPYWLRVYISIRYLFLGISETRF